ncbi:hypothetical protein HOY82DRAFT_565409 [Tuber indicum]|nr:hypothetical protein HOY82DRAFT_565409 [Tuber indicum]
MKNLAQLCFLTALAVVPSLAADLGPQFQPDFQPMDKPNFEKFYPGIVPATNVPGLGKRQSSCPTANSFLCPNTGRCCPVGYTCNGDTVKGWCCPIGEVCDSSSTFCPAGQTDCSNLIGVSGCCPTATHRCSNSTGTPGCARLSGSNIPTNLCDPGTFMCADGIGCCPDGTRCVAGTTLCRKPCDPGLIECPSGGCCELGFACDDAAGLCRRTSSASSIRPSSTRAATIPTLDNPFTSISARPTSIVEPASPTGGENIETVETSPSPSRGPTPTPRIPTSTNGGNVLKPGGWLREWLGGFGTVFFLVFFHL